MEYCSTLFRHLPGFSVLGSVPDGPQFCSILLAASQPKRILSQEAVHAGRVLTLSGPAQYSEMSGIFATLLMITPDDRQNRDHLIQNQG